MLSITVLTAKDKAVHRDLHTFMQKFVVLSRMLIHQISDAFGCPVLHVLETPTVTQSAFKFISVGSSHNDVQVLSNSSRDKICFVISPVFRWWRADGFVTFIAFQN